MRVSAIFEPSDLWIGLYWDSKRRHLYILPLPMIGFLFRFKFRVKCYRCKRPAELLCVHAPDEWGKDGNRDPLCMTHGKAAGPCQDDPPGYAYNKHIPIPTHQRHYYERRHPSYADDLELCK